MYVRLLVSVLFLSATSSATFVINVEDYLKKVPRNLPVTPRDVFDIKGFLSGHGYPLENHRVTTEDGYILTLHRIPNGKEDTAYPREDKTKPAVLVMHGICASSVGFFILGPEKSLALMLADLGYDVWLGNNRGNTWSRKHQTLSPDDDATFWDYSFHELGVYDVPATIDYILNATGNEKLSYVGHSQGTTQFFAMAALKPEYNEKITIMSALGPAVFLQNLSNPIVQTLSTFYGLVDMAVTNLNITEVLPFTTLSATLQVVCGQDSGLQEACATVLFLIFGFDSSQLNRATLSILFQDMPAGSSAKEILHYLQEVKSGHFRQFDYGEETNMEVYKSSEPPDYNLEKVTAPVALYYGENDWLVGFPDVDRLIEALPNVVEDHQIGYRQFNHIDFIFANDVASLLYFDVINLLNSYNGFAPITSTSSDTTTTTTTRRPPITKPQTTSTTEGSDTSTVPSTTPSSAPVLFSYKQTVYGLIVLFVIYLLE